MTTISVTDAYTIAAADDLVFSEETGFDLTGTGAPVLTVMGGLDVSGAADNAVLTAIFGEGSVTQAEVDIVRHGHVAVTQVGFLSTARGGAFDGAAHVSNDGEVLVQAAFFAVGFQFFGSGGSVDNSRHLTVNALGGSATAIFGADQATNSGRIAVRAAQDARGVEAHDLDNAGLLRVTSNSAIGAKVAGGFLNTGSLVAHGDFAVGVEVVANSTFDNQGSIRVGHGGTTGVKLDVGLSGTQVFTNEGLIQADVAFQAFDLDTVDPVIHLGNSGRINGAVVLGTLGDELDNSGRITGDVRLEAGDDVFNGAAGRLIGTVSGGDGSDLLTGGKHIDQLSGDADNDTLAGGRGADILSGGAGDDHFIYQKLSDSKAGLADAITDLDAGDVIDLSAIDADRAQAGDQAFVQVSVFSGHAGELTIVYDAGAGLTTLLGDVDGDGQADLEIEISGDHHDFAGVVF